jgi:hypothetical protein
MLAKPSRRMVLQLYEDGLTTRQVAEILGMSYSWVWKLCKRAGVSRSKAEAIHLRREKTKYINARSARHAARHIWEARFGKIATGKVLHHKDGNCLNNSIENLELLSTKEHWERHNERNNTPRHLRPKRKAYMRRYFKDKTVDISCAWCGVNFKRSIYSKAACCSHSCATHLQWSRR